MTFQEQFIAFKTIVIKEIYRFSRIWVQTIIPPVITISLYFVIFGNLIGSQIGDMNGFRYMDYIVPGLIMMAVITNSYANVVSSFYGCKFHRHIEESMCEFWQAMSTRIGKLRLASVWSTPRGSRA